MANNIKNELNNNNEIPNGVREKLDTTYENILSMDVDSSKTKNRFINKHKFIGISTVAASFVVMIGVGIYNPSLADGIPILGNMLDKIHFALKNDSTLKYNIDEVNKSSTYNGLTITIDKAMYDGNQVYVDFTFKTDKPFKDTEYAKCIGNAYDDGSLGFSLYYPEFKINGKKPKGYSHEMPKVNFTDEYTLKGSTIFDFDVINEIKSNIIDFEMYLSLCSYEIDDTGNSEILDGTWSFSFPISSNQEDTQTIKVNEIKNNFTLNQVLITPMSISIDITAPKEYYKTFDIMEAVEVKTNKGNTLWATSGNYHNDERKIANPRYNQRYDLNEIGDDLEYINVTFYGEYNKKTKTSPILADFKVNLNK